MRPSRASQDRKDALAESRYQRKRRAATAAKVIPPRTPSKILCGSRLLPAFSASLEDYFSMLAGKFNHDPPREARARFRQQSQASALCAEGQPLQNSASAGNKCFGIKATHAPVARLDKVSPGGPFKQIVELTRMSRQIC